MASIAEQVAENRTVAELIVADELHFDNVNKLFSITNIRNHIVVERIPCVVIASLWVKLWLSEADRCESVYWLILNERNEVLWFDENREIRNMRQPPMRAGIDFGRQIRFRIDLPGNYAIRLFGNSRVLAEYPVYVALNAE